MLKALSRRELENALKLAASGRARATPSAGPVESELSQTLFALALLPRLKIIDLLRDGPRTALQVAKEVGGPRANFSRHLRQLADAGLITIEISPRDARQRIVSLRTEPFDVLGAWVATFKNGR